MTNPTCERCGNPLRDRGIATACEQPCQPQQEYHHPDYCKTCKADIGITGVCAVHGQDQPQQERSEEIYGIMFKDKDGQFVMSNSETAHDFLKRKADKARADERKKVIENILGALQNPHVDVTLCTDYSGKEKVDVCQDEKVCDQHFWMAQGIFKAQRIIRNLSKDL